jgi:Lar family restriction alleviation protein
MDKIRPCPFCGSKNIKVFNFDKYGFYCGGCLSQGPAQNKTKKQAIASWNNRAKGWGKTAKPKEGG